MYASQLTEQLLKYYDNFKGLKITFYVINQANKIAIKYSTCSKLYQILLERGALQNEPKT